MSVYREPGLAGGRFREYPLGFANTDVPNDGFIHRVDSGVIKDLDHFIPRRLVIPSDIGEGFVLYGMNVITGDGQWVDGIDFLTPVEARHFSECQSTAGNLDIRIVALSQGKSPIRALRGQRIRLRVLNRGRVIFQAGIIGEVFEETKTGWDAWAEKHAETCSSRWYDPCDCGGDRR